MITDSNRFLFLLYLQFRVRSGFEINFRSEAERALRGISCQRLHRLRSRSLSYWTPGGQRLSRLPGVSRETEERSGRDALSQWRRLLVVWCGSSQEEVCLRCSATAETNRRDRARSIESNWGLFVSSECQQTFFSKAMVLNWGYLCHLRVLEGLCRGTQNDLEIKSVLRTFT